MLSAKVNRSGLHFNGRTIQALDTTFELKHRISDVAWFNGGLAVIFDPEDMPKSLRPINLSAFSQKGQLLWVAAPFSGVYSHYVQFLSSEPLRVSSWSGFLCTIGETDGSLLESVFTK
jgi:hypothetical protein